MEPGELRGAVARAVADETDRADYVRPTDERAADAAIRVVLAEAKRSIEALQAPFAYSDLDHGYNRARREALAVLAALGDEA